MMRFVHFDMRPILKQLKMMNMKLRSKPAYQITSMVLKSILPILIILLFLSCQDSSDPAIPAEKKRELANALYNQQLYEQAIEEYREYLRDYPLDARERSNISYQIANIYFDRVNDYENALAFYIRAKHLYLESDLQPQISKKVVECLERLQRSNDARQVIAQTSALDESQKPQSKPGEVIAKIGEREITTGDLAYQMNQLPEYLQSEFQSSERKEEFLKQYIAQELLYDSAKRKGLDSDKEVIRGVFQAKKSLMVEKLLEEEIDNEARLENYSNADVETYYKANKEKYVEKDENGKVKRIKPFSEVAQQAAQDFIQEKKQQAYQNIIERLMNAEQVVIYENKIK